MDYISTETLPYLGTSGSRVLRCAHLPLMRRGLLTALSLVFVEVMKEMPATLLLRPFGLDTLAVAVWKRTSEAMWQEAAAPAWPSWRLASYQSCWPYG